jgi:hypothetical protein
MKQVMIDIETLGTGFNSCILSIAAVQFEFGLKEKNQTGKTFYKKIKLESNIEAGLKIDADTLKWWLNQNPQQLSELFSEPVELSEALDGLDEFFKETGVEYPWGNGINFDLVILRNAYNVLKRKTPWSHRKERDCRTIENINETSIDARRLTFKPENAHNALADCYYQIEYITKIINLINYTEKEVKSLRTILVPDEFKHDPYNQKLLDIKNGF